MIAEFIKNNKIKSNQTESSLNADAVVVAGYACYLITEKILTKEQIETELETVVSNEFFEEYKRIFDFCIKNNYQAYWKKEEAKSKFIY